MKKKFYVLGFIFDRSASNVLLIQKSRPKWQFGKLNGIGGKIEKGETPGEAMTRECLEECGLKISEWIYFCTLRGEDYTVECFAIFSRRLALIDTVTRREESLLVLPVGAVSKSYCVPNVPWLVEMALLFRTNFTLRPYIVEERGI